MKKLPALAIALFIGASLSIAGCGSDYGQKETVGGLTGAALGGVLGAQFGSGRGRLAMTGVGVLVGALMGSNIGRSMDDVDRLKADRAAHRAHSEPLGSTITWNNPDSGNRGTVTPVRDGTMENGQYCREYRQTITVAGKTQDGYGIACQQPDGSWRLVSQ